MTHLHSVKGFVYQTLTLAALGFGEPQRQFDVLDHSHGRNQIEGLKNHTYLQPTVTREFLGRHLRQVAT